MGVDVEPDLLPFADLADVGFVDAGPDWLETTVWPMLTRRSTMTPWIGERMVV
jgi:hypothetical protein